MTWAPPGNEEGLAAVFSILRILINSSEGDGPAQGSVREVSYVFKVSSGEERLEGETKGEGKRMSAQSLCKDILDSVYRGRMGQERARVPWTLDQHV